MADFLQIMHMIYWVFWARKFLKSNHSKCSTLLNSIKILPDDRKSTLLVTDSFSLKRHIFERTCIWMTGFEENEWEIEFYWKHFFVANLFRWYVILFHVYNTPCIVQNYGIMVTEEIRRELIYMPRANVIQDIKNRVSCGRCWYISKKSAKRRILLSIPTTLWGNVRKIKNYWVDGVIYHVNNYILVLTTEGNLVVKTFIDKKQQQFQLILVRKKVILGNASKIHKTIPAWFCHLCIIRKTSISKRFQTVNDKTNVYDHGGSYLKKSRNGKQMRHLVYEIL